MMTARDVVDVVRLLEAGGVEVVLDGGWGVDALLGVRFSRPAVVIRAERQPAACTIAVKLSASRLAPPTRAPSMSGQARRSRAFSFVTLPPYWMRTVSAVTAPWWSRSQVRIAAWAACAWSGVAVSPVPIAHTGSYAIVSAGS